MQKSLNCRVRRADWTRDRDRLREVRGQVFVVELGIPEQLEWDDQDEQASHFIAETAAGEAVGAARLLPSGQIGRMAVLPARRRAGVGSLLMQKILIAAKEQNFQELFLHAQMSAVGFYERWGFTPVGGVFYAAGISHQTMRMAVH